MLSLISFHWWHFVQFQFQFQFHFQSSLSLFCLSQSRLNPVLQQQSNHPHKNGDISACEIIIIIFLFRFGKIFHPFIRTDFSSQCYHEQIGLYLLLTNPILQLTFVSLSRWKPEKSTSMYLDYPGNKAEREHFSLLLSLMNCYITEKSVHKYTFGFVALVFIFCVLWLMNLKWVLVRKYNSSISLHTSMILSKITNLTNSRYSHSAFHPKNLWPQTELQSIPEIQSSIWRILFLLREIKAMLVPPSS